MNTRYKTVDGKQKQTPEYMTWNRIKGRCYNKNKQGYKNYGGRGIKVCDRWLESFENFYEDMGKRPDGYEIDRVDNNGDYSPDNCRWITSKENRRNRRSSRLIEFNGEVKNLSALAEECGVNYNTVYRRLTRGWSIKKSLQTPTEEKYRPKKYCI